MVYNKKGGRKNEKNSNYGNSRDGVYAGGSYVRCDNRRSDYPTAHPTANLRANLFYDDWTC
jgi:hypothetical protein